MRVSQYAWLRVRCQIAQGLSLNRGFVEQLSAIAQRSAHPLLHLRLAGIEAEIALQDGNSAAAEQAALRQAQIAGDAGLLEMYVDALLLQARANPKPQRAVALLQEAQTLAETQGFVHLAARARNALSKALISQRPG